MRNNGTFVFLALIAVHGTLSMFSRQQMIVGATVAAAITAGIAYRIHSAATASLITA